MKVAYLLVTTAWLAGAQTPAAQDKKDAPQQQPAAVAPITVYGNYGGCGCSTCDSGCGGFLQRCKDFCGRLFQRNSCDTCNTCVQPVYIARPVTCCAPAPTCNSCGCGGGLLHNWGHHSCFSNNCNSCGSGDGFLSHCKNLFGRWFHNDCCNTCNTCGSYGAVGGGVVIQKGGETIPPPKTDPAKKMPDGKNGEPPQTQIPILTPAAPAPLVSPLLDTPPAPPALNPAGIPGRPF